MKAFSPSFYRFAPRLLDFASVLFFNLFLLETSNGTARLDPVRYMLVYLLLLQSQFSDYIADMLKFLLARFLQIFWAQVNSEHVEFI